MRPLGNFVLVLLLLSSAAVADSIPFWDTWSFGNTGGTLTFNPTTETLTMTSTITTLIAGTTLNNPGVYTGDFGTITVTTGPLISGSILSHAIFSGGTITITTNGTDGLPDGILFFGTLSTPIKWYELGKSGEFHLGGKGYGQLREKFGSFRGFPIDDFGQLVVLSGTNQFKILKGATVIPEPGTLVLVATGLGLFVWTGMIRYPSLRATRRDI
jgi:hypothetical protein